MSDAPAQNAEPKRTAKKPRSRRRKFFLLLMVNVVLFSLLFIVAEIGIRWYREGSLGAAFESLTNDRPVPRHLGTNDWLVPDPDRGYALNTAIEPVNDLAVRHGPIEMPKPNGRFRVLVVGDSVAWDVPGFVSLLRDELAKRSPTFEVINASVPGYTSWQERLTVDHLVPAVDPDLVLLQYCLNDNHRFLHQLDEKGGMLLTQEARRALLSEGDGLVDRFLRWSYVAIEVRRRLFAPEKGSGDFPWETREDFGPAWQDRTWPAVRANVLAMRERASTAKARFAVVAFPFEPQLAPDVLAKDRTRVLKPQLKLGGICQEAKIPYLDLHGALAPHHGESLYRDQVHLTERGHELSAGFLLRFLDGEGLLKRR